MGSITLERVSKAFGPHVVIHGCETRRVVHALERFKVQLREIHAIPVEARD